MGGKQRTILASTETSTKQRKWQWLGDQTSRDRMSAPPISPIAIINPQSLDTALASRLKTVLSAGGFRCKVKDPKLNVDLILPAVGCALIIVSDRDLLYSFTRKNVFTRLAAMKKNFKQCFTLLLLSTTASSNEPVANFAFSRLVAGPDK